MPSKSPIFTPSSILFRPHQQPPLLPWRSLRRLVVEAPGTAPGSEWFITSAVYRHSRSSRQNRYRGGRSKRKGRIRVGMPSCEAIAAVSPQPRVGYAARSTRIGWRTMRQYLDLLQTCARQRARPQRPHRHRHALAVRLPDALRPGAGLSRHDDQEAASEIDHPRASVVPFGRYQHQISQRQRRHDLGRMGRRERRPRPGLRQAVALLAGRRGRQADRPDQERPRASCARILIRAA